MKKVIKIEGMHCSHCATRVCNALAELGLTANVKLPEGTATVEGADVADAKLKEAVEDLGFDVVSIEG